MGTHPDRSHLGRRLDVLIHHRRRDHAPVRDDDVVAVAQTGTSAGTGARAAALRGARVRLRQGGRPAPRRVRSEQLQGSDRSTPGPARGCPEDDRNGREPALASTDRTSHNVGPDLVELQGLRMTLLDDQRGTWNHRQLDDLELQSARGQRGNEVGQGLAPPATCNRPSTMSPESPALSGLRRVVPCRSSKVSGRRSRTSSVICRSATADAGAGNGNRGARLLRRAGGLPQDHLPAACVGHQQSGSGSPDRGRGTRCPFALRMTPSPSGTRRRYGNVDPGGALRVVTKSSGTSSR